MPSDLQAAWKGVRGGGVASIVAVVALAIGIGASVTAATMAYAGLLRPLPFPEADRLISLQKFYVPTSLPSGLRLAEFDEWRNALTGVIDLTGYAPESTTLRADGRPREISAGYVVDNWFDVLAVAPEFGRLLNADSPADEAVVSRRLADELRPGDPAAILGQTLTVGVRSLSVVGVLPARVSVMADVDLWTPARGARALTISGAEDTRYYLILARLRPGRTFEAARIEGAAVMPRFIPEPQRGNWVLQIRLLRDELLGDSRPVLITFVAASVLVLFVACANVTMLLINRVVVRSREFAIRVALGAGRGRLLRVATIETAILAMAGAVGGWAIAVTATRMLADQRGLDLPGLVASPGGAFIVVGVVAVTAFVVVACAAAPLVMLRRGGLATALRATKSTGSRGHRMIRGALVVSQLAMTVVLLTGAVLLGRTLLVVSRADIGLEGPEHVVAITLPIRESTLDSGGQLALVDRVLEDLRRQPGVVAAGLGGALPPSLAGLVFTIRVTNDADVDATRAFDMVPVTDGYFEALGARLVAGRTFTRADALSDEAVCVMSESALKHLAMVGDSAVGRESNLPVRTADGRRVKPRIVGVVRDVRYSGLDASAHGGIYVMWRALPRPTGYVVARTTGDPATLAAAMTRIVRGADPSMPLQPATLLTTIIDRALAPRAARFRLVGVFALGAALLGFVGLSGALIRSVVERERELAIRSAVGATPRRLLADVFRHGLLLTVSGLVVGLVVSAVLARALSSMLYGVTPHDLMTYSTTAAGVFGVAMAACYWPARRAAASDPVVLLRSE